MQEAATVYAFGEWRLDAGQRLLFRAGTLVSLPPKVLETLLVLVERHGQLVEKEELMTRLWPDTFVEEGNVLRNVSTLRKALGDGEEGSKFIETIPRRGYRFVASVEVLTNGKVPAAEGLGAEAASGVRSGEVQPTEWRRHALLLAGVIVLTGLAGLVWWLTAGRPALSFADRDWVLLADFENQTGDPRFDRALQTAFAVSLRQSRHANFFPRPQLAGVLKRMGKSGERPDEVVIHEALAREIAQRENLRAVVACSITRAGNHFELIARLVDPQNGQTVADYTERVEGEDHLLQALDRLAANVRQGLGESLYAIHRDSRPLPQVTTPSLEALQFYAKGLELWRARLYGESLQAQESAVRVDADFAMAHAALGSGYGSNRFNENSKSREHFEKAMRLTARTTERERKLIELAFHSTSRHFDDAIRLASAYLQSYPDDTDVRLTLAYDFLEQRRCDESIAQYREVLRISANNTTAQTNTATCLILLGKPMEALEAYRRAFQIEPSLIEDVFHNHQYGVALILAGQPEKAREVYTAKLSSTEPAARARALRSLGFVDMYEGRYRSALQNLESGLGELRSGVFALVRAHLFLSQAAGAIGDSQRQFRELKLALAALGPSPKQTANALNCRIGVEFVRMGELSRAEQVLLACGKNVDQDDPEGLADWHRLEGELELERGNKTRAFELIEKANQETRLPLAVESLAHAYELSGRADEAIETYEKLLQMTEVIGWEAQQPWTEAHIAVSRLYIQRNEREKARKILDALLKQWKNGDRDLPMIREALALREKL